MRKRILENGGAVLSEYPPATKPYRGNFPVRNRIISGLSRGVLGIEAPKHSGALITAGLALEQNRDVFALPGSVRSETSFGTNQLIKDGAKPVTCPEDILEEYAYTYAYSGSLWNVAYHAGSFSDRHTFKLEFTKHAFSTMFNKIHDSSYKRGFTTAVIADNSCELSGMYVKAYILDSTFASVIY